MAAADRGRVGLKDSEVAAARALRKKIVRRNPPAPPPTPPQPPPAARQTAQSTPADRRPSSQRMSVSRKPVPGRGLPEDVGRSARSPPAAPGKDLGTQSLAYKFPGLAAEWDTSGLNGALTGPECVRAGSNRKVWWRCGSCDETWQARVDNRTQAAARNGGKVGCPRCRETAKGFEVTETKSPRQLLRVMLAGLSARGLSWRTDVGSFLEWIDEWSDTVVVDRKAFKRRGARAGYCVNLGVYEKGGKRRPFQVNEFDALWIHLPEVNAAEVTMLTGSFLNNGAAPAAGYDGSGDESTWEDEEGWEEAMGEEAAALTAAAAMKSSSNVASSDSLVGSSQDFPTEGGWFVPGFYYIPAEELRVRGYLTEGGRKGKWTLHLYPPFLPQLGGVVGQVQDASTGELTAWGGPRGVAPNTWANQFFYPTA